MRSRQNNMAGAPEDVQTLIPGICDDVTLHGKKGLRQHWDGEIILDYSSGPNLITRIFSMNL